MNLTSAPLSVVDRLGMVVTECKGCSPTLQMKVAPSLQWLTSGVLATQPFDVLDKPFTMDYALRCVL
jgi:hypothetical protein